MDISPVHIPVILHHYEFIGEEPLSSLHLFHHCHRERDFDEGSRQDTQVRINRDIRTRVEVFKIYRDSIRSVFFNDFSIFESNWLERGDDILFLEEMSHRI